LFKLRSGSFSSPCGANGTAYPPGSLSPYISACGYRISPDGTKVLNRTYKPSAGRQNAGAEVGCCVRRLIAGPSRFSGSGFVRRNRVAQRAANGVNLPPQAARMSQV
jgi:hypothetical protein